MAMAHMTLRVDSIQEEVLCFGCHHVLLPLMMLMYILKLYMETYTLYCCDYVRKKSKNNRMSIYDMSRVRA